MNEIKLPPLPEARIVSYQTDSTMRRMELRTYSEQDKQAYATAAIEADRQARGGDQQAAFEAWQERQHPKVYPAERQAFEAGWQAALESPEVRVTQYMAECMVMVRDELIEAEIIDEEVAPMFVTNAVLGYAWRLRRDAERLEFLIAEECQIQAMSIPNGKRHRIYWPDLDEAQSEWFANPRAAIDYAMEKQK